MATGFTAQRDDGTPLFDASLICYGLRESGYLVEKTRWTRYYLKSAQLDPSDASNYAETGAVDPLMGFTVTGAIAPIVFINGQGISAGSSFANGETTFYFAGATSTTKFFYFDTMRNEGLSTGFKTFKDDAANTLTFNSAMVPLNIIATHLCPPPSSELPGWPGVRTYAISGGTNRNRRYHRAFGSTTAVAACFMESSFFAMASGNLAACATFSRNFATGMQDGTPGIGYSPRRGASGAGMDGVYGGAGGIYWSTIDATHSPDIINNTYGVTGYWGVPTDRYPLALVINIDNLPFPYTSS